METTADKLAYLEGTKAAIREAIAARGVDVPESTPFRAYAGKIGEISGGGGGGGEPIDPEALYRSSRPTDWLPLPEPEDDEIYFLFHVPAAFEGLLAFTAECTGSYTVEYGTTESGAFVPDGAVTVASGTAYEGRFAGTAGHSPTQDGMAQLVFRVSGQSLTSWSTAPHSLAEEHSNWDIVDFVCRMPGGTKVQMGNYDSILALSSLRYFAWFGTNSLQDMTDMFSYCTSLLSVRALDTTSVTDMTGTFYNCSTLRAIPAMDTSNVTSLRDAFSGCSAVTALPAMDFSQVENMTAAFENCFSLRSLPWLTTTSCTQFESAFKYCGALRMLPPLSVAGSPGESAFSSAFNDCISLERLCFTDTGSGWSGGYINLINASLSHAAIVELFDSLPAVSGTMRVMLTGNPGSAEITEAEKQAMNAKGWQLQY